MDLNGVDKSSVIDRAMDSGIDDSEILRLTNTGEPQLRL